MDGSGNLIPVPLKVEEEEAQFRETLQRSIVEKCASHMPYFKGAVLSGYELQQRELEEATKHWAEMKDARARGKGASAQGIGISARGVKTTRSKAVLA